MTDSESIAQEAAYEASQMNRRVAIVTPNEFPLLSIAPKHIVATLLSEKVMDKDGRRTRTTSRCRTPICVYNVSKQEAFTGEIMQAIKIQDDQRATTILRVHCEVGHIPRTMLEEDMTATIKKELNQCLPNPGLVDLWKWRMKTDVEAMGFVRVATAHVETMLQQSGLKGVWVDTPLTHKHLYAPLWLGKPQEVVTLTQAKSQISKLDKHLGIIRKQDQEDKWTYALRVATGDLGASKQKLEMDSKLRFKIQGPPAHVSTDQIQEILRQMAWEAEIHPERRWQRGHPTWHATASKPPPCNETHVQLGYERCWLRIRSTQKPVAAVEPTPLEEHRKLPMTWQQATKSPTNPRARSNVQGKGRGTI